MIKLNHKKIKALITKEFEDINLCKDSIKHVVDSMIETSLRGIDSHGINLFPHYYKAVKYGRVNCNPNISIEKKSTSAALISADHAFGHYSGSKAIELAQELARKTGVGAVAVADSTHFGAAGYFALQASRKDFLAFAFTNADALVRVFNAKKPYFGTNPICFTAPMDGEEPFCLDMATSIVSWNKILNSRRTNKSINPQWASDYNGVRTQDPVQAAMLEAIGTYKGFGLGMMVDILCGILSGGPCGVNIIPMFSSPIEAKRNISHFFIVLKIESFTDPHNFKKRLKQTADEIRSMRTNDNPVYVPGDPEKEQIQIRKDNGIPIDEAKFNEYLKINKGFQAAVC